MPSFCVIGDMNKRLSSYRELRVYQLACDLDLAIHQATKTFPPEERYSLTDQVRRSSRSIGANLAEAWAKRRSPAHFVSKITDADGELQETTHWLGRAHAYGYLSTAVLAANEAKCSEVGRMLGRMIAKADSFGPPTSET